MIIPIIRRKFYIVFTFCPDTQSDLPNTSHENRQLGGLIQDNFELYLSLVNFI